MLQSKKRKYNEKVSSEKAHKDFLCNVLLDFVHVPLQNLILEYLIPVKQWIEMLYVRGMLKYNHLRYTASDLHILHTFRTKVCLWLTSCGEFKPITLALRIAFVIDEKRTQINSKNAASKASFLYFYPVSFHPSASSLSEILAKDCDKQMVTMENDFSQLRVTGIFNWDDRHPSLTLCICPFF